MTEIQTGIHHLIEGRSLSAFLASKIMKEIMTGEVDNSQIASYLTALAIRGENSDVISGTAQTMRDFSERINPTSQGRIVDIVGTGGDKSNTFNISTLAALIAAGAGVTIAKHGNRSVSSKCGSADILEQFGVNLSLSPCEIEKIISEIGIGFMFAPKFHPAMKYAVPVRKSLAMRTIFNILGPLTNPANAEGYLLGVYTKDLIPILAEALVKIGVEHAFIVNSEPGIDELIPKTKVYCAEIKNKHISFYELSRKDFDLPDFDLSELKSTSLEENVEIARKILSNQDKTIRREIVILNAAYGIISSGITNNLKDARMLAQISLESGAALSKLKQLVIASNGDMSKFSRIFE